MLLIIAIVVVGILFGGGLWLIPRIAMREVNYNFHTFDENTYDFENEVSLPDPAKAA